MANMGTPEREFLREIDQGNLFTVLPYYRDVLLDEGRERESRAWDLIGEKGWKPFRDGGPAFRMGRVEKWEREGGKPRLCWTWCNRKWVSSFGVEDALLPDPIYCLLPCWLGDERRFNYSEWPTRLRAYQELVKAILSSGEIK